MRAWAAIILPVMKWQTRTAGVLVVAFACWLMLEAGLWTIFRLLPSPVTFFDPARLTAPIALIREQNSQFDAALGWRPRVIGAIGERPHSSARAADIAAFGDSFTFGDEVGDAETWEERLGERLNVGVLNFGVGGYGIDQALLNFERRVENPARTVVLAFISENINRNVNVYRKFYFPKTQGTFTKPRFIRSGGALSVLPNPIQQVAQRDRLADADFVAGLGMHDYWYNHRHLPLWQFPRIRVLFDRFFWRQLLPGGRVNPSDLDAAPDFVLWDEPEARDLTIDILRRFVAVATERGQVPILVHMPVKEEIIDWRANRNLPSSIRVLQPICAAERLRCLFPLLQSERVFSDLDNAFSAGGHYSVAGNAAFAQYLADALPLR